VLELSTTSKGSKPSSVIFQMMKTRLLQHRLADPELQLTDEQMVMQYYKPFCEQFLAPYVTGQGLNYHFVMLTILHQRIEGSELVLGYLLGLAEQERFDSNEWRLYAGRVKRLMCLITSILGQLNEINVEYGMGAVNRNIELLNKAFSIRHFVNLRAVKESRLFTQKRYSEAKKH
jgi:hypothetical protein